MTSLLPAAALLAPVPEIYLREGEDMGRVAFGSRAWNVLRDFDEQAGPGAPVWIYASHPSRNRGPVASWRATWVGWIETSGGPHPEGDMVRPASTMGGKEDCAGYWAGFWEVRDLHPLGSNKKISELTDIHGRKYRRSFIPEGPILLAAAT